MKGFVFSISALVILIALILCNSAYIKHSGEELQNALNTLPACAQAADDTQELLARWKKQKKLWELSVPSTDITEIENRLTELDTAARLSDEKAFEQARALCQLAIARVCELERFSFHHIL